MSRKLDIRPIKRFVAVKLPKEHPLHMVLLMDDDWLDVETFIGRIPIWLRLASLMHREANTQGEKMNVSMRLGRMINTKGSCKHGENKQCL